MNNMVGTHRNESENVLYQYVKEHRRICFSFPTMQRNKFVSGDRKIRLSVSYKYFILRSKKQMDIIKLTRELGAAIQQDERYKAYEEARKANEFNNYFDMIWKELNNE